MFHVCEHDNKGFVNHLHDCDNRGGYVFTCMTGSRTAGMRSSKGSVMMAKPLA